MSKRKVMLDLETYTPNRTDINKGGHKLAETVEILMASWSYLDDEKVEQADFLDANDAEKVEEFRRIILDSDTVKIAHNAQGFEMPILEHWTGCQFNLDEWEDSAALAKRCGYPAGLADLGVALGLPQDKAKDKDGKRLMALFSWEQTKRKNGEVEHYRLLPKDAPEEYQKYRAYNRQDVVAQKEVYRILKQKDRTPKWEEEVFKHNYRVNSAGICIDKELVEAVLKRKEIDDRILGAEFKELVGCNFTQRDMVKKWMEQKIGYSLPNMQEQTRKDLLAKNNLPDDARRALEIYNIVGGSANSKYKAMIDNACSDGRFRDGFRYYGAGTGRWSSEKLQLQNFYRSSVDDLDSLRELAKANEYEMIEYLYGPCLQMFKQIARTALIAGDGKMFVDFDFSSIEARVSAWIVDMEWKLKAFREGRDVYLETAARMFDLDASKIDKHTLSPDGKTTYRQMGKVAELAGGYGGGVPAYAAMDKTRSLTETQLESMCNKWRTANNQICNYWYEIDAILERVMLKGGTFESKKHIIFENRGGDLIITLPSGRPIVYVNARLTSNGYVWNGKQKYEFEYDSPRGYKVRSYGAKIFENVVQGIARDCLAQAMLKVEQNGYQVVMHVHDEMVVECPKEQVEQAMVDIDEIMRTAPDWAYGLPIKGEGYSSPYFKKD